MTHLFFLHDSLDGFGGDDGDDAGDASSALQILTYSHKNLFLSKPGQMESVKAEAVLYFGPPEVTTLNYRTEYSRFEQAKDHQRIQCLMLKEHLQAFTLVS